GVIPLCAALAAQEHGDARRALDLLRISAEIAERASSDVVTEEHVRMACERIEMNKVAEVVRTLPLHSKIVLGSMLFLGRENCRKKFTSGEIYNMYRKMCVFVGIEPLTQRRVSDLIAELDMLGLLNATVVSRGRYGRTKEISLSVPEKNLRDVLFDHRLKSLESFRIRTQMTL
ncbi:cell division control protein Cdc6, partial [Methanosarcinales archaeon]